MSDRKPLWPKSIEVIGGTGEYESGKTTFGLTICPGPETLYYDFEKSGASYEADLGFTRVDVPAEMQRRFPKGYKPVDVFNWWLSHVRSLQAGQYRVIVADPASDIEQGLADWVAANPKHFGKTPGQYIKMSGIMWGDMKSYWKAILADIAARCETFYFTTHMSNVWKGDRPSKERKAKGKETLFEMASLYLRFERKKDVNAVPSAVVLKSRLSKITINEDSEDGEVVSVPLLPPRLPKATPAAVRKYMNNPPDYSNLKPEELVGENKLTEDEKLLLRAEIANAERDTAMVVSASEGKRLGGVRVGPRVSTSAVADDESSASAAQAVEEDAEVEQEIETEPEAEVPHGEELAEAVEDAAATVTPIDDRYPSPDSPVSKGQLGSLNNAIAKFLQQYPDKQESIDRAVKKRNPKATHVSELTNGQAEDMEASLLRILNGPHETPETAKLEKAAAESQPSTPDTGKGAATKARTKRS